MVEFVFLLDPAQDRDRVLDRRLFHHHGLETPGQSRVLLDIFAILVERRRAHAVQLTTGQRRLDQVGRVHRAVGFPGTHERMHLVDEQDDLARSGLDFLEDRLQTLFEFTAIFRTGDQRAHVEREEPLVAQALRHVPVDDAQREALRDRGLTHAGFTDQNRVVLGPTAQHLHRAPNLVITTDDRVDLALLGSLGQIARVFLERLIALFGRGRIRRAALAQIVDRGVEFLRRYSARIERILGARVHHGQSHQHTLHRDEAVARFLGNLLGLVEHAHKALLDINLPVAARHFRQFRHCQIHGFEHAGRLAAGALDQIGRQPLIVIHQSLQKMLGHHTLMTLAHRDRLRGLKETARPLRELLHVHRHSPFLKPPGCVWPYIRRRPDRVSI